jgi:orotidine-5'-phosphate decarboxylase
VGVSDTDKSFAERFAALRTDRGPFCLNLDPTPALLSDWGLRDDIWGLRTFCNTVIDAADRQLAIIKPQSAYFERFGAAGFEVLADIIGSIHALGSLALLDAKRGDIGSTNSGYADGLLGPDSAMAADGLTVHAYLGFAALAPILERAVELGCGIFPVVLSSNPEGRALQSARRDDGLTVCEGLAAEITEHNARVAPDGVGPVGAVVGVTAEQAPAIIERLPRSLILSPGLGAQGGTFEDVSKRLGAARERVIPCAGRSVLSAGPGAAALKRAIEEHCGAARRALS